MDPFNGQKIQYLWTFYKESMSDFHPSNQMKRLKLIFHSQLIQELLENFLLLLILAASKTKMLFQLENIMKWIIKLSNFLQKWRKNNQRWWVITLVWTQKNSRKPNNFNNFLKEIPKNGSNSLRNTQTILLNNLLLSISTELDW